MISESKLVCSTPSFPSLKDPVSNVTYTIRMGNAPGPNLTLENLTLEVRLNPMFAEDGSAIMNNQLTIGEGSLLTLMVKRLNNIPSMHTI